MKKGLLIGIVLLSACSKNIYSESTFFNRIYASPAYDVFGSNKLEFYPDSTYLFVKNDGPSKLISKGKWNYNADRRIIVLKTSFNDTVLERNNSKSFVSNYFVDVAGQEVSIINSKKISLQGVQYVQSDK